MNLHSEIMNIKYAWDKEIHGDLNPFQCYIAGHRDARHRAAELALKHDSSIAASLRRLAAAVRQAGDISEWPVCGDGDVVGDEMEAALVEAEWLAG